MTWANELASVLMDGYGNFVAFPETGGIFAQNQWELDCVRVAWRARDLYRDPTTISRRINGDRKKGIKPNPALGRFMAWMNGPLEMEFGWIESYFGRN